MMVRNAVSSRISARRTSSASPEGSTSGAGTDFTAHPLCIRLDVLRGKRFPARAAFIPFNANCTTRSDIRIKVCFIAILSFLCRLQTERLFCGGYGSPASTAERKRLEHGDCDDRPKSQKAR